MTTHTAPAARKETGLAYLFLIVLGVVGGHKFYLRRTGMGFIYLFTLGLLGVGVIFDLFTLPRQVRAANGGR